MQNSKRYVHELSIALILLQNSKNAFMSFQLLKIWPEAIPCRVQHHVGPPQWPPWARPDLGGLRGQPLSLILTTSSISWPAAAGKKDWPRIDNYRITKAKWPRFDKEHFVQKFPKINSKLFEWSCYPWFDHFGISSLADVFSYYNIKSNRKHSIYIYVENYGICTPSGGET